MPYEQGGQVPNATNARDQTKKNKWKINANKTAVRGGHGKEVS